VGGGGLLVGSCVRWRPPGALLRLRLCPCGAAAGHLPKEADGKLHAGKVGRDLNTDEAYKLARLVAINIIATIKGKRDVGLCARCAFVCVQ
jgi:hypothetical protein